MELTEDITVLMVTGDEVSVCDVEDVFELRRLLEQYNIKEYDICKEYKVIELAELMDWIGNGLNYIITDIKMYRMKLIDALNECGDLMNEYDATMENAQSLVNNGERYLWHDGSHITHGCGPWTAFIFIPENKDDLEERWKEKNLNMGYLKISEDSYIDWENITKVE